MNALVFIINIAILALSFVFSTDAAWYNRTIRERNRNSVVTDKRICCDLNFNSVADKLKVTDEQQKSLEQLAKDLQLAKEKATADLNDNNKKLTELLVKGQEQTSIEKILQDNSTIVLTIQKKEIEAVNKIHAILDETQRKRLQRMREDRLDDENEETKNGEKSHAFSFNGFSSFSGNHIPSILPPEESSLLGLQNSFFSSNGKSFSFGFNDRNRSSMHNYSFSIPDIDVDAPEIEIPDIEIPDEDDLEDMETLSPKESRKLNKEQKEKLERSLQEMKKKLKEMEKEIKIQLKSHKNDEI